MGRVELTLKEYNDLVEETSTILKQNLELKKELIEANNSDLLANLINNLDKGKESYDDIFNKIKVYKSKYDFSKNVIYPVSKRFEEIVGKIKEEFLTEE